MKVRAAIPVGGPMRGFTLLELLVVMTLLSLVVLAMASALRTAAQTQERVEIRLAQSDDVRVATAFLRTVLSRVSAERRPPSPEGGSQRSVWFAAENASLEWVGVMPVRPGIGGRHFMRLAVETRPQGKVLVLRYQPWAVPAVPPVWDLAASIELVREVRSLRLSYEDTSVQPAVWTDNWPYADRFPARVVLRLESAGGPWMPVVVPLRALPGGDATSAEAVFGGGGS
ncbi:MAG: prepilin-type N-terminal cleavage/methylation domain-containing protein [Burkholderiaceae bacterium]